MPQVLFGIDTFLSDGDKFRGLRLALITNNAATTSAGILTRVALLQSKFDLVKLFSPEHGLTARGEDGAFQENAGDVATGLRVTSLYGDQLKPSEEDLFDIDAILFDIPDVGCRFYTYSWTMTYVMEACAEFNKPLIILDRPNPISGDFNLTEGSMLDETNCSSFIGRWSIPVRHSCTPGELANYFAATRIRNLDLQIIEVRNWKRTQGVKEAKWFFVPPSPAIVDDETVFPKGSELYVKLSKVEAAGRVSGRSEIQLQLDRILMGRKSYLLSSSTYVTTGASQGGRTARSAGIGAAIGAAIGAISGGGKGAAIGGATGAGAGAGVEMIRKGEQVRVDSETRLDFRLENPIEVTLQSPSSSTPQRNNPSGPVRFGTRQ